MTTRLKEIRKMRLLSAKRMSELLGVSYSTYMRYEAGQIDMSLMQAIKSCDILECSLDDLIGREDYMSDEQKSTIDYYYVGLNDEGRQKMLELSELVFMSPKYRSV